MTEALFRVETEAGACLARGSTEAGPQELLSPSLRLDELLAGGSATLAEALADAPASGRCPPDMRLLAPVEGQEVWCSGVSYQRSRDARMEESTEPDIYDRIYEADRPELFFKAPGWRVQGPGAPVGVRLDSGWDMAEPELGLVVTAGAEIAGYVIGNDLSSRTIEGENPLYLPQAKVFDHACALGPAIVPAGLVDGAMPISMRITRAGETVYEGSTSTDRLKRTYDELVSWLFRALRFPLGVVLLTGTGVVPEASVTLKPGDIVRITIEPLGVLENPVIGVG